MDEEEMTIVKAIYSIIIVLFFTCSTCYAEVSMTRKISHHTESRADGGYNLILTGEVQSLLPLTAEGFFPKRQINYKIILKGKGKDWSYRNQPGYYYSYPDYIESTSESWDIGYAWVDKDRETIYLNFYWIKSPDSLAASEINGTYKIKPAPHQH